MRNIMQPRHGHKHRLRQLAAGMFVLTAVVLLYGCDQDSSSQKAAAHAKQTDLPPIPMAAARDSTGAKTGVLSLDLRTSALDAWLATAKHLKQGQHVPDDEFDRICTLPGYTLVYGENTNSGLNPVILRNVMTYTFAPGKRRPPKRKDLINNYAYLAARFDRIDQLVDLLKSGPLLHEATERAIPYLEGEVLPDTLTLDLVAAGPAISGHPDGVLILDVGLALAAGPTQLERIIATTLIRALAPPVDPEPYEAASGSAALCATVSKLKYESIIGWVADYPALNLDESHPTFALKTGSERRETVSNAGPLLEHVNEMLSTLLDSEKDVLASTGESIDQLLRLGDKYEPLGYAMAALIVDVFGETRFQQAAVQGVQPWLELYQEAALSHKGSGDLGLLPPFSDHNYAGLRSLLDR